MSHHFVSDNYKINVKPGTFMFYAKQAANCENLEKYIEAEELWGMAERRAVLDNNRDWAKARHDYCERVIRLNGIKRPKAVQ